MVVTHAVLSGAEAIWPIDAKVVDIFRMDEKGKVVEHWDVLSPLSPTSENGNPEV
jgi:predicted SnoaL-like aldol condensation-catalyzing enzyme